MNYPWPLSNRDVSFETFELWGTALTWGRGVGGSDLPTSYTFYSWFPPPWRRHCGYPLFGVWGGGIGRLPVSSIATGSLPLSWLSPKHNNNNNKSILFIHDSLLLPIPAAWTASSWSQGPLLFLFPSRDFLCPGMVPKSVLGHQQ